ncbi:MAG: hypothetical protein AAF151_03695 [Cyanobacteria bacterium J06656_5]
MGELLERSQTDRPLQTTTERLDVTIAGWGRWVRSLGELAKGG